MRLYLKPTRLNWHPHFALIPRLAKIGETNKYALVWLETIEKRTSPAQTIYDTSHDEYRIPLAKSSPIHPTSESDTRHGKE